MAKGIFPIEKLQQIETPFYYYDAELLRKTLCSINEEARKHEGFTVHYAVKANANPKVLRLIREALHLTPAARPGHRTTGLYPVAGRLYNPKHFRITIALPRLRHYRFNTVAHYSIRKKEGIALQLTYPLSVLYHIFYTNLYDLVLPYRNHRSFFFCHKIFLAASFTELTYPRRRSIVGALPECSRLLV